jgi:tetratricopeptide (TPR) repeat protein
MIIMNGEGLLIILVVLAIIIIIIISTRKRSEKHIQKAYELEQQGRHLDALDYFARNSLEQAANLVLRTPEASQILVLRRLEKRYHLKQIEKVFLKIARTSIGRNDPHTAASAFVLAKKPFAAAKVFIDSGSIEDIPAAIQIIDRNISLIHNRDQAIRNLARHAYNNRKYMEAAELLRTIEADEEANAVIIAAATEMKKQGRVEEAESFLTTIRKPAVAIEQYLLEVKKYLKQGNIEKMRRSLAIAKDIIEKLPPEEKHSLKEDFDSLVAKITEYDRLLKILDSARDILRKKNTNQAIALYDELLESLGEEASTPILAEAALANEESDPQYASKLFHRAALQAQSPRAAESFRLRAKKLEIITKEELPSVERPVVDFDTEVEEFCSVCRMRISEPSTLIRCPDCGSPAHYSHLAEWLKIRGHCPICKKKIKIQRPKGVTF